jgi:photosystem II stability/assembly factor-like uncharacterized protein
MLCTPISSNNISWIHPLPQGNSLLSITHVDDILFTVGEYGTIMKSVDYGENWDFENKVCGIETYLRDVTFCDADIGLIVGDDGVVLRTENGGNFWNLIDSGINADILCIEFIDVTTAYAGTSQGLYKTTDLGNEWLFCGLYGYIKSINFLTEQIGFLTRGNQIFKTEDGGNNWYCIYNLTIGDSNWISDICFFNDSIGLFVGGFYDDGFPDPNVVIYKTYNGGIDWSQKQMSLGAVISISNQNNYVYTPIGIDDYMFGSIYQSDDYGENWYVSYNSGNPPIYSISLLNDLAIAVGYGGKILKQEINNTFWDEIGLYLSFRLVDIQFVNSEIGYLSTYDDYIYKSQDGGNTWEYVNSNTLINKFFFINEDLGFGLGYGTTSGMIYKTIDGGLNWQWVYFSTSSNHHTDIFFVNSEIGFVAGYLYTSDYILITEDGGENWQSINIDEVGTIMDICFINEDIGFFVDGQNVFKTINGGYNWLNCYSTYGIYSIFFPSQQTGYIVGYNNDIIKTIDCGNNWFSLSTPLNEHHNAYFINDDIGFVSGDINFIKTEDGGNSWQVYDYLTSVFNNLSKILFFDENHGLIVGDQCIFRYEDETGFSDCVLISSNDRLINYPNPFNPSTTISFSTAEDAENVEIEIYNIKGQKVKELLIVTPSPDHIFSVTWDGMDGNNQPVSSGIYFCKLKTGNKNIIKKMLLLK